MSRPFKPRDLTRFNGESKVNEKNREGRFFIFRTKEMSATEISMDATTMD